MCCFANELDFRGQQVSNWMLREQQASLGQPTGCPSDMRHRHQKGGTDYLLFCKHFYPSSWEAV